jgi:hypothetical protein
VDQDSIKHYFILAVAPDDGKFSLKINSEGLHGSFDPESGYVSFLSQKDMPKIVYVPAILKPSHSATNTLPLRWSEEDSTISVKLPKTELTFPVSLVFATFSKIPTPEEVDAALGHFWCERDSIEISQLELDPPHFTFDDKVRSLYGKIDHSRLDKEFKTSANSASLASPGTNLQFLLAKDGVFTVGPKNNASQPWSVRVVPSFSGWGDGTQVYKGGNFVGLRSPDLEQGASTSLDTTKHFFILPKGGCSYSLRFEGDGIGKIQQDKSGKILFVDSRGRPLFVYSKPSFRIEGKKVIPKTNWNNKKNELQIEVPDVSCPIGVVCAVCTCTIPPETVIYSIDGQSLAVLHPRVRFFGKATAGGISYNSMPSKAEPWSINFSIEGSEVKKIYAKSKCTVAINRTNHITEFLSYVDRGEEFLGLHHSLHITSPPAAYTHGATLRIPIAITCEGITQVTQNEFDSLGAVTFYTTHGPVFSYERMIVSDARGTVLRSRMRYIDGLIMLEIMELGEYPLVMS